MRTPTGEQKRKAMKVSMCVQWSLLQFMRPNAPEGGIINRKWDEEHWETKTGALQFIGSFCNPGLLWKLFHSHFLLKWLLLPENKSGNP